jgi:PAS domain S-box-containing protein
MSWQSLYERLFYTMQQGVVYQDADGTIVSMNPAAERILGKTRAEFLGQSSVSVEHDTLREDGSPFPGMEHPAMVALRTGREVCGVLMQVYNPREQRYRCIKIDATPLFHEGEDTPYQVYTIFEDISERRKAEHALRQNREWLRVTLTSIGDGVIATDVQGRITFLNPVAADLTGWQQDEAEGRPIEDVFCIVDEETRQPAEDLVGRVLREGRISALANSTALVTRDGREVPIEDSAAPILDADGAADPARE